MIDYANRPPPGDCDGMFDMRCEHPGCNSLAAWNVDSTTGITFQVELCTFHRDALIKLHLGECRDLS